MTKEPFLLAVARGPEVTFDIKPFDTHGLSMVARCGHRRYACESVFRQGQLASEVILYEAFDPLVVWLAEHLPTWIMRRCQPMECRPCEYKEYLARSIACGLCGRAIFPGSEVSLYGNGKLKLAIREHATFTYNHSGFVGCTHDHCLYQYGGAHAGWWTGHAISVEHPPRYL